MPNAIGDLLTAMHHWPVIRAGLDKAQNDHEIMRAVLNLEQFLPIYAAGLNKALHDEDIKAAIAEFIQLLRELHANA